jgi:predicted XRE-type DNA-binding protein
MSDSQAFVSVWDAIEDTPQEAVMMRARSRLIIGMAKFMQVQGIRKGEAAALFGVSVPRLSKLLHGHIDAFTLDDLVSMAAAASKERSDAADAFGRSLAYARALARAKPEDLEVDPVFLADYAELAAGRMTEDDFGARLLARLERQLSTQLPSGAVLPS